MPLNKRPRLNLPWSRFEKTMEIAALSGVLLCTFLMFGYWSDLPDRVPVHFSFSGEPDSWDSKWMIALLPAITIFLYTLLTIGGRYPHYYNYLCEITEENAEAQYRLGRTLMIVLKTEIVWLFTIMTWESMAVALERCKGLAFSTPIVFILLITGTVVVYFIKSSRAK